MAVQIPVGAERGYLITFGVAAIYVAIRGESHALSACPEILAKPWM